VDLTIRAGADSTGHALAYTPNPVQPGSTISHWDTSAFPNQLMEPAINADLTHSVTTPADMTLPLLRDVGWFIDANLDGVEDGSVTTTTTLDPASGQYSDQVTFTATVSPATAGGGASTISGSVQFKVNGVSIGSSSVNSSGVATKSYTITNAAASYTTDAIFTSTNPDFTDSTGSSTLTVSREDAVVTIDPANPQAVKVNSPGGTAGPITLVATITEVADGSLGNICLASPVNVSMVPVGPGSTLSGAASVVSCDGTTLVVSKTFTSVPVNVYDVTFSIGGNYYTGSSQSVLAVYDPSLGFVTGGGTVFNNGVRANFGMNVKYQKNGGTQGSFLYIEHRLAGDYVVKGTAMKSLSIVGNQGILLTKNVVANGVGNYNARVVVIDNGEPGKNDAFGITLYDPSNAVVGDIDYSASPITLSGGNISVPQKGK
jgi:hypothetical protein